MKAVFLDIDNTLLSFDGYVKQTMKEGFEHFGLSLMNPICSMFYQGEYEAVAAD